MTIIEILKDGSNQAIINNLGVLADDYKEKLNKVVCKTCPSSIRFMVLMLKNYYKMTQFRFKTTHQYKNKKGDKVTISNSNIKDETAIEFLKTNPDRIRLFEEFPSNWKELIEGEEETEEEKAVRLEAEAELAAATSGEKVIDLSVNNTETEKETTEEEKTVSYTREELLAMSLKELRELYPDVKATSIKLFVDKVLGE